MKIKMRDNAWNYGSDADKVKELLAAANCPLTDAPAQLIVSHQI